MRPSAILFPFCYFLSNQHLMSTNRKMPGGWADRHALPQGPNGRRLCRWCNLEVPKGRQTFCSAWCVEEWRLRSDPGYIREKVLERDRGVCAGCGVDCLDAERQLKRLRGAARLKAFIEWGKGSRKSLWDADHIVPVVEGGGECDLQNIRTLCLKCHRAATAQLRQRRRTAVSTAASASETA
jgi:5-methylcytosine-specific restriction endonuclease McrA